MLIKNALVENVRLEIEDHGILTAWLMLDYGDGSKQGFGGFHLDKKSKDGNRVGIDFGITFILRCLDVVDVREWNAIKGKNIRVKIIGDVIVEIGHITKEIWFNPYFKDKNSDIEYTDEMNNMSYEELKSELESCKKELTELYDKKHKVLTICHHFKFFKEIISGDSILKIIKLIREVYAE